MAEEYSGFQIFVATAASSGLAGFLWTAFVFFNGKLEARRKRLKEEREKDISQAAELGRLKVDTDSRANEHLWRIIDEKTLQIKELKAELEEAERAELLTRPIAMHVLECVRLIKNEIDSLNLMILNEHDTNVFSRRWGNIKAIIGDLENTVANQREQKKEADALKEEQKNGNPI